MATACLFRENATCYFGASAFCSRRPTGDVTCGQATPALRFPQGSGYKLHVREYPRLPPCPQRIFAHNPLFFVTFCTHQRRKLFASDVVRAAFVAFASQANSRQNVAVGRYVIMPDHVHLFVRRPDDLQLRRWVGMLKQTLAKQIAPPDTLPI